jgi:hypothetical protein
MSSTDSSEFMDHIPAISLRENERGMQIGAGWNPHYHQATDRAQRRLRGIQPEPNIFVQIGREAVAELAGASLKK